MISQRYLPGLLLFTLLMKCFGAAAGITGTVADPSGAVMAGVMVTARNSDTGAAQKTVTNSEGVYAFPGLPEGRYVVEVEHAGFQPYRSADVAVVANNTVRVEVQLTLETHGEAITVSESASHLETTNTQMGELIAARQAASIPVNGRSYTDLLALQPGVIPASRSV